MELGLSRVEDAFAAFGVADQEATRGVVEVVGVDDAVSELGQLPVFQVRSWPGRWVVLPAWSLAVGNGAWEDPEDIEPFVAARMARQARLSGDHPLECWAVISEGTLRQLVGGRDVMREQLERLLEMADLPNVRLQVVPYLSGAHPGMASAFTIVSFGEPGALDVVQADMISTTAWLESEADSERHSQIFERIARLGLAQQSSLSLIDSIRKEM